MNKEICFIIDSKELLLEQVLVEYNDVPVYFVCKDEQNQYYIILCTDIENENYVITKTEIDRLRQLLKQKITMRDIILSESYFWDVSAGDQIEDDIYEKKNIELINLDDLPYENSYFKVVTKAHEEFLNKLNSLFFQLDNWEPINIDQSNYCELCSNQNPFINEKIEFRETIEIKILDPVLTSRPKNSYQYDDNFDSIQQINQLYVANSENKNDVAVFGTLKDSKVLEAA